jgi:hypothetical protein
MPSSSDFSVELWGGVALALALALTVHEMHVLHRVRVVDVVRVGWGGGSRERGACEDVVAATVVLGIVLPDVGCRCAADVWLGSALGRAWAGVCVAPVLLVAGSGAAAGSAGAVRALGARASDGAHTPGLEEAGGAGRHHRDTGLPQRVWHGVTQQVTGCCEQDAEHR